MVDEYADIPVVIRELNDYIKRKKVFISGAFSSFDSAITEFSHNLSKSLTEKLLKSDYRIVNGIGRRFGTHLIGYANEYLAKRGVINVEKHLIVKPFVGNSENAALEKRSLREKVINQCGASIFVFGEQDLNSVDKTSGVWEEFEIALKLHKTIIPIAYPGMVSEKIWKQLRDNITEFPYLEKYIPLLTSVQPVEQISKIIVQILDSIE